MIIHMLGAFTALILLATPVPRPLYNHPEWGPEPPAAPYGREALPSQWVDAHIVFPVLGDRVRWHNDYGADRGAFLHTGIDIKAPKMTPIVAPISGVLGMKRESFWIYRDDGFVILGTHLNDDNLGTHDRAGNRDVMFAPGLEGGQHVEAGQFIGYVGMSGDATAPHLHFEIYAPGSEPTPPRIRCPVPSLKAAVHIREPKAYPDVPASPSPAGQVRVQGYLRGYSESRGVISLILLYHEVQGHMKTITYPTWLSVGIDTETAMRLGGWDAIARRSHEDPITLVLNSKTHGVVSLLERPFGVREASAAR